MLHCNLCGNAVAENEYRLFPRPNKPDARGLTVCNDCQRDKPRCAVCQTPMPEARAAIGICAACMREGLNCRLCGEPIRGKFTLFNGNDGPYCDNCTSNYPRCDLCGAPAGPGSQTFPDERVVCQRCNQTAITDPRDAEMLFERVIDLLGSNLGLRLNIRPRLTLIDHARLVELARQSAAETGHDSKHALGLFTRMGRKRVIYLQEFLPRIMLIQIVAHEFAHAWQGENCPLMSDPVLREGFAEWVAYHALLQLDAQKKVAQMLQRRDLYGDGLRQFIEIEKREGVAGALQLCRAA